MRSSDQYNGSIEQISTFLNERLSKKEKVKFIKFIFANVLLFNSDLHKKNISFIYKKGKLKLSPAYDILNVSAIKGKDKNQSVLKINGKIKNIKIKDFAKAIKNLRLNKNKLEKELKNMLRIYLDKYPKYINRISQIKHLNNPKWLENLYKQSYKKVQSYYL